MKVVFHRLAIREYLKGRRWYAERSPPTAERFRTAIEHAAHQIDRNPDGNLRLDEIYRYVRLKRFPYLLIYRRLDSGDVLITAVYHTARRSGYWRRRK